MYHSGLLVWACKYPLESIYSFPGLLPGYLHPCCPRLPLSLQPDHAVHLTNSHRMRTNLTTGITGPLHFPDLIACPDSAPYCTDSVSWTGHAPVLGSFSSHSVITHHSFGTVPATLQWGSHFWPLYLGQTILTKVLTVPQTSLGWQVCWTVSLPLTC